MSESDMKLHSDISQVKCLFSLRVLPINRLRYRFDMEIRALTCSKLKINQKSGIIIFDTELSLQKKQNI